MSRTWIIYNKPEEPNVTHAGLLLALGLHYHLDVLNITDIYQYYSQKLVEEAIEKIKNDSIDISDSTIPPMRCPIDNEISIIKQIVGPSVGTVVRGMGSLAVRTPKKRGPAKGNFMLVSTANEDDLRQKLVERDEQIGLRKEGQDKANKEAAAQRTMIESLMAMYGGASDANSNATTPTNNALG